jgi:hypothetical protein
MQKYFYKEKQMATVRLGVSLRNHITRKAAETISYPQTVNGVTADSKQISIHSESYDFWHKHYANQEFIADVVAVQEQFPKLITINLGSRADRDNRAFLAIPPEYIDFENLIPWRGEDELDPNLYVRLILYWSKLPDYDRSDSEPPFLEPRGKNYDSTERNRFNKPIFVIEDFPELEQVALNNAFEYRKQTITRDRVIDQTRAAVANFTTVNQLVKVWPQVIHLLPEDVKDKLAEKTVRAKPATVPNNIDMNSVNTEILKSRLGVG